ncbi:hypothetical protein [Neisseria weixii]
MCHIHWIWLLTFIKGRLKVNHTFRRPFYMLLYGSDGLQTG